MHTNHIDIVATELEIEATQAAAVSLLLNEGATIPFIARYRKEATGSLDEVVVAAVRDRLQQLQELDARREAVRKSLETHGHLTPELLAQVEAAPTLALLEDIYLPFRPKRRTRATMAREKGLAPLAEQLLAQEGADVGALAATFISEELKVPTGEAALAGARDIIAEIVNEDAEARRRMRQLFESSSLLESRVATGKETEGQKFKDYFDWREPVGTAPSHRILAMRRGENEDMLNLSIQPPEEEALALLDSLFIKGSAGGSGEDSAQVALALRDGYKRLLARGMETEMRLATKTRADQEAIRIFADNLRQLLLAPPLGARHVMGLDPGFRTGCKVVCLDPQGKLQHHDTVYLHLSEKGNLQGLAKIAAMCRTYKIDAIAVGNGTAGRETEALLKQIPFEKTVAVIMVNESGASIYSASEIAREEFPDLDLTVRGAISIARRLMDPLAELVKIDPKSIGVGQYQHDVDQAALRQALDDTVISCVNAVGVEVNRASAPLLTYVSGLGPQLARNIVAWRDQNGPFQTRAQLRKVPRLGPKAFEQCAGFLRVPESDNPLDASAVHPESYHIVDQMAEDLNCRVADLMQKAHLRQQVNLDKYVSAHVGRPTLEDILAELAKPGRDPRPPFETFAFAADIAKPEDLQVGMRLPGIVTNVTAFGAFVDIGVHQDGLVHISELAEKFVKDPHQVVKLQQHVQVRVLGVDLERKRIALSLRRNTEPTDSPGPRTASKPAGEPSPKARKPRAVPAKKPEAFNNPFSDALNKWKEGKG